MPKTSPVTRRAKNAVAIARSATPTPAAGIADDVARTARRRGRATAVATAAAAKWADAAAGETQHMLRRWQDVVPHDRLAHLVKHAIRALDRALQLRLAEHEVAIGHWVFLRALWEGDGLTQRQLSREAGVMEPTTFAALKAMEARGYVVRRQLADNRRNVHVFLTAKGRAMEQVLVPLALECNVIAVRGVPAGDVTTTRRTLLAMLRNLAQDEIVSVRSDRRIASTRERGRLAVALRPATGTAKAQVTKQPGSAR